MDDLKMTLQAVKLKGRIHDRELEITETLVDLPEGDVEVILLYHQVQSRQKSDKLLSPIMWPVLDGGRYLGGSLHREDLYGENER
jgi:hypothetical protein